MSEAQALVAKSEQVWRPVGRRLGRTPRSKGAPVPEGSDVVRRGPKGSGGGRPNGDLGRGRREGGRCDRGCLCETTKAWARRQRGHMASSDSIQRRMDSAGCNGGRFSQSAASAQPRRHSYPLRLHRCSGAPETAKLCPRARWDANGATSDKAFQNAAIRLFRAGVSCGGVRISALSGAH